MRKGQLSTEYLVILAVVVVVALIVVTVLGGFIDLGGGASATASKAYWRSADIGMTTWRMVPAPALSTFVIRNNQDFTLQVNEMTVATASVIGAGEAVTLSPGKTATITSAVSGCTAGNAYNMEVAFQYNDVTHGINNIEFTGIKNIEGTC